MLTTLYKLNNTNEVSWWKIEVKELRYIITWGQRIEDIDKPTANTNVYECPTPERALDEADSRIREQKARNGYVDKIPKKKPDLPMLAQPWNKHEDLVKRGRREPFKGVSIQPKLDGLRCLATNRMLKTRRNLALHSVPHISNVLSYLPDGYRLDGELYVHGTDLQTIQSYVRRQRPHPMSSVIQYHVFDLVDTELAYSARRQLLEDIINILNIHHEAMWKELQSIPAELRGPHQVTEGNPIKLVPEVRVNNTCDSEQVKHLLKQEFKKHTNQGYEGLIIRDVEGFYEMDYRSPQLLKYKERLDDEFLIVDVHEGYDSTGIFYCKTKQGQHFEATPAWTTPRKKQLLRFKENYIGKMVTVEYEKMSSDGIPLKPVAKNTREVS